MLLVVVAIARDRWCSLVACRGRPGQALDIPRLRPRLEEAPIRVPYQKTFTTDNVTNLFEVFIACPVKHQQRYARVCRSVCWFHAVETFLSGYWLAV